MATPLARDGARQGDQLRTEYCREREASSSRLVVPEYSGTMEASQWSPRANDPRVANRIATGGGPSVEGVRGRARGAHTAGHRGDGPRMVTTARDASLACSTGRPAPVVGPAADRPDERRRNHPRVAAHAHDARRDERHPAKADPARLEQVFANLLSNAVKYTEPGGRIDVTVARHGDEVVVRIRDTGIGIASELFPGSGTS